MSSSSLIGTRMVLPQLNYCISRRLSIPTSFHWRQFPLSVFPIRRYSNTSNDTTESSNATTSSASLLRIRQIPVKSLKDDHPTGGFVYEYNNTQQPEEKTLPLRSWSIRPDPPPTVNNNNNNNNNQTEVSTSSSSSFSLEQLKRSIHESVTVYFLPAQYPKSVAPGYLGFVTFCFSASVAGSAAMVLSTQTLLLAVGIVGSNTSTSVASAGIMAGALNWVMKDFVGQIGGVIFASQMGQTRAFDNDPKRWRMVAAMAMDAATLLEILSPLVATSLVLPIASVANIGKNIGFLTASASRAALHQSLAISGNLGDVTAKSGSQSIMASLLGTSLGIALSSLLQHDTLNFAMGFLALSIIHQGCNYQSLQYVPLAHFNIQRLGIVLEEYITSVTILNPTKVSERERFFPLVAPNQMTKDWLHVGRPLQHACPDPLRLEAVLKMTPKESPYLLFFDDNSPTIDVIYFQDATGEDVICGIYHAWLIRSQTVPLKEIDKTGNDSTNHDDILQSTYKQVQKTFPSIALELQKQGWNTSMDVTTIETALSMRISMDR
ncbi:Vitamin B6 photo-protection and homoeostasis domain containing protein [Nitzschia inconspicua]|uniref:Vitamin B6 photo-protection and homoeostasis domain containing protein n=1 Tax=Nitzschia inconspicua TaxID=303405 RepID=A0A9K3M0Y7_9STRA|nr:Vitamin B6 photo-protection and homoeostasis domain containing protein [Nitzschia inconspicua]